MNLFFDLDGTLVDPREGIFSSNLVYDGIADTLESLRVAGASLFVATSKPIIFASEIIRQHGLIDPAPQWFPQSGV